MAMEFVIPLEHFVRLQYQAIILTAGLVLLNTMACRVFRVLRLDTRRRKELSGTYRVSNLHFLNTQLQTARTTDVLLAPHKRPFEFKDLSENAEVIQVLHSFLPLNMLTRLSTGINKKQ